MLRTPISSVIIIICRRTAGSPQLCTLVLFAVLSQFHLPSSLFFTVVFKFALSSSAVLLIPLSLLSTPLLPALYFVRLKAPFQTDFSAVLLFRFLCFSSDFSLLPFAHLCVRRFPLAKFSRMTMNRIVNRVTKQNSESESI